jgi:hypothetical protein
MERHRCPTLLVMGALSCAFAVAWFVWLVVVNWDEINQWLALPSGPESSLDEVPRRPAANAGLIRFNLTMFAVKTILMGVLAWTGYALFMQRRSARSWALGFCILALGVALFSTIGRMFFLTLPGEPVMVIPFVMDAAAILFANVLCGAMFLPEVKAAYQEAAAPVVRNPVARAS